MASSSIVADITTIADLRATLAAYPVVLVDFYGTFCRPCKALAPVIEGIQLIAPGIKCVKVDVEAAPELGDKYAVKSIPTIALFSRGNENPVNVMVSPPPAALFDALSAVYRSVYDVAV